MNLPKDFDIPKLLEGYKYKLSTTDEMLYEKGAAAWDRGYLSHQEAKFFTNWKSHRSQRYVYEAKPSWIEEVTKASLSVKEPWQQVQLLTALEGVGIPMASTWLHFVFPDQHIIIDWRARESLGLKHKAALTLNDYIKYRDFCMKESEKLGVSLRELDKCLFAKSSQLND